MGRYAIFGAGSLGTVLGAFIARKGGRIDLINHNIAHVEALRTKGAAGRAAEGSRKGGEKFSQVEVCDRRWKTCSDNLQNPCCF